MTPPSFRRKVGRVRADLTEALARIDSRELPEEALTAIGDAHHALTEAVARLRQHEARETEGARRYEP